MPRDPHALSADHGVAHMPHGLNVDVHACNPTISLVLDSTREAREDQYWRRRSLPSPSYIITCVCWELTVVARHQNGLPLVVMLHRG